LIISKIKDIKKAGKEANLRFIFHIVILLSIYVSLYPTSAQLFGNGILLMEINKLDLPSRPMEQFSVECFYYDKPNNNRSGDLVSFTPVPKNAKIHVELKADTNFLIEPSRAVPIDDIGSVEKWDVTPRKRGDFYLVLYYTIGRETYKLASKMIKI
jgi:hypothetical protein